MAARPRRMPLQSGPNTTTTPRRARVCTRLPRKSGSGRGQMIAASEVQTIPDARDPCQNEHMPLRRILVTVVGVSLAVSVVLSGAATQMPLGETGAGMVGIGHTVFDGTHVEEFKAHIIGVLENVIGTHRNLILAKLEGGPLANTGVIAGMSGSPVYIDGKLVGAVSYALGSFSKEPIAGITPIAEMTDSTNFGDLRPPGAKVKVEYPLTRDGLTTAFRKALNWNRPFAERPADAQLAGLMSFMGVSGGELATLLRPIATPLVMSGFEPDVADVFGAAFRDQGFIPMAGGAGTRAGEMPYDGALKPGDAVGITVVDGGRGRGATGTVRPVAGARVSAFGHPMYILGPTEFPMTRAYVYTVLRSRF